jgi:hypothetical protein
MAEIQAQVYARASGLRIAEIEPHIASVAWRHNNVATCKFSLAYDDAQCTPDNLASGNRLVITFDNGLPTWGGVIDFPLTQTSEGVSCTAYTGHKLLDWRVTAKARYFDSQPPGYVFQTLITEEATAWPLGLTVATVWTGGTVRTLEYHYHDLLRRVLDLVRLTGNDFVITPMVSGGVVTFWASWLERRGTDKTNQVTLAEGHNVTHVKLDHLGPIANVIYTIGEGSTWGAERLVGFAIDYASISTYGFREYAEVQSGVKHQTTLDANAAALLAEMAYPRKRFTVQVTNKDPSTFDEYDVGDRVTLRAFVARGEWAYSGTARIIAREWLGGDDCRLEVEEWTA